MTKNIFYSTAFLLTILFFGVACQSFIFKPNKWSQTIPGVGSMSSPVAVDLNKDGIKDIVIGAGGKEFSPTPEGVLALDGNTGDILWKIPARNQVVGSAICQDITKDGIPDIFIGGRSAIFYALDGRNGEKIWEFLPDDPTTDYFNDSTILNFYSPQFIPDVDKDGQPDILTAYGGFIKAKATDLDRPVGALMVLSSQTGEVLARAAMPDGKEIYSSPIVHDFQKNGNLEIIFGTGGEVIKGGLYRVNLSDVLAEDLSNATLLADGKEKGFIAPPLLIDINLDLVKDIVVNSVDGRLIAIDGQSDQLLWEMRLNGTFDTYNMPAPGYFVGEDKVPDFFTSFGKGPWPDTEYTVHTLVDGKTGKLVFQDTLGTFQYASPVVADFTNDGQSDVLLAINGTVKSNLKGSHMRFLGNDLYVYPNGQGNPFLLTQTKLGSNLGTTPLLTDLDNDGYLDVIRTYMGDPVQFYSFKDLIIERIELNRSPSSATWGNYMGPNGLSIFE